MHDEKRPVELTQMKSAYKRGEWASGLESIGENEEGWLANSFQMLQLYIY